METEKISPLLVDEKTAAKLLCVSIRTLFNLRRDGALPFVRLGAAIRYRVEAIERYLREREQLNTLPT